MSLRDGLGEKPQRNSYAEVGTVLESVLYRAERAELSLEEWRVLGAVIAFTARWSKLSDAVTTVQVAQFLDRTPKWTRRMLRSLRDKELIEYVPGRGRQPSPENRVEFLENMTVIGLNETGLGQASRVPHSEKTKSQQKKGNTPPSKKAHSVRGKGERFDEKGEQSTPERHPPSKDPRETSGESVSRTQDDTDGLTRIGNAAREVFEQAKGLKSQNGRQPVASRPSTSSATASAKRNDEEATP